MKNPKNLFLGATILFALFEGAMPLATLLFAPQYVTFGTKALGYPDYFAYALVIAKILGVLALILPQVSPKIKEWAYAGFTFNLLFAVISHGAVDGVSNGQTYFPLLILAVLSLSYINFHKLQGTKGII